MELLKGFDRYLDLKWTDYCLWLYLEPGTTTEKYADLQDYLHKEISGSESARKTANQLKRLWLNDDDRYQLLRSNAAAALAKSTFIDQSVFHLGMAINVFPIFKETCQRFGELSWYQNVVSRHDIKNRVSETYLNPSSVPRAIDRVIQTLASWNFIKIYKGENSFVGRSIKDSAVATWFIQALMTSRNLKELSLSEFENLPEKLGVRFIDLRGSIHKSTSLALSRNALAEEMVEIKS